MKKRPKLVVVFVLFLCSFFNLQNIHAQSDQSSKEIAKSIDSLFADKKSMDAPGASVIVMKGEKVLFTKNYGAANLTFGLPFDKNTVFPLAGFAEQIVMFSILQLEKKGLIDLDHSVNKYVPEFGFEDGVTLSHLMNHSSGFPMISSLRLLAGWNFSDPFTKEDFTYLSKKVTANLDPDKSFVHNHAGIKILMMVIEKATGKSFSEYAATNIFHPLGMTNTVVKYEGYQDKKNNTIGYTESDGKYIKVVPLAFEVFCPNVYSTQVDFQKWMANVQSKSFNGDIIERMDEALTISGKLQDRSYGSYCIGQQQYRHYLGQDEFFTRETGNGYSWMWLRLTQSQLSVMVVGNQDAYVGPQANGIADLLGEYKSPAVSTNPVKTESAPVVLSKKEMELCTGIYWNEKYMYTTEISIKDGGLYHSDTDNNFNFILTPVTSTLFKTPYAGDTVEFSNLGTNQNKMRNIIPNGRVFDYKQYDVPPLKEGDQLKYEGVYTSDEFNSSFKIKWENSKLILKRSRKVDLELTPIGKHQFRTSDIDFRVIEFKKDIDGEFQEMHISNPSLKNIAFVKQ